MDIISVVRLFLWCHEWVPKRNVAVAIYERRSPENELLYKMIAQHWPGIVRDYAARDVRIAPHVHAEFERYLRCGILQHGFVRLKYA